MLKRFCGLKLWVGFVCVVLVSVVVMDAGSADVTNEGKAPEKVEMTIWEAVVLGVVEGLTEYLPVSSTGHLLVVQKGMGIGIDSQASKTAADAYAICIQAGAILAVLGLYMGHVRQMGKGLLGKDEAGRKMFNNIVVAFIPAAVIGLLFDSKIEEYLFGLGPIVIAWLVGGIVILFVAQRRKGVDSSVGMSIEVMTYKMAVMIGLMQCVAMWPGTSRSLMTILGGVMVGLSLTAAVEFSFLLGVLTLGAATVYKGLQHGGLMLETYGWLPLVVGFVAATVSAVIAVKWMVGYLNKHSLAVFGYYRIALAVVVYLLFAT